MTGSYQGPEFSAMFEQEDPASHEIDTDPDCPICKEAAETPHLYVAPDEGDDGCQFELQSGHLCGDQRDTPQHQAGEDHAVDHGISYRESM